jgi:hypothetical protein
MTVLTNVEAVFFMQHDFSFRVNAVWKTSFGNTVSLAQEFRQIA